jgi:small subunit ribosomal protein S18
VARSNDRDRGSRRVAKDTRPRGKKKICIFCKDKSSWVDYKDVNLLRKFMSDRGKIRARRVSGNCAQHQRDVATAIKTARELALLPYSQRTVSERGPSRQGPRGAPPAAVETEEEGAATYEGLAGEDVDELEEPGGEEVAETDEEEVAETEAEEVV